MCYYVSNLLTKKEIKDTFGANLLESDFKGSNFVNGFTFPKTPVVVDRNPTEAFLAEWGLIPFWSKDRKIQRMTLNARIETVKEKSSFRNSVNNRCIVLVKGFYEWKWLDERGKAKEKFFLQLNNDNLPFALGGIYNVWKDKDTNEDITTFSIVTSGANELMAEIHNTKDRMPLVLTESAANAWLLEKPLENFMFPSYDPDLIAHSV